jgi:hypothetical protein
MMRSQVMPTTIPLGLRDVNVGLLHSVPATTSTLDFVSVAAFSTIGLLLTIAFALFPLSPNVAALLSSLN